MLRKVFFLFSILFLTTSLVGAEETTEKKINLIIFERDDCQHCQDEKAFLSTLDLPDLNVISQDVKSETGRQAFVDITEKYDLPLATPITLVGNSVIVGFDKPETSGQELLEKISQARANEKFNLNLDYYLGGSENTDITNGEDPTCGESEEKCEIDLTGGTKQEPEIEVEVQEEFSFFGKKINTKNMGLFSLSAVLGTLDGFNPCAMWVLFTFLIALSQIGSRRKMAQVISLFLIAEGVMYFLILNVWYQTWDFIKLDSIITPAIGLLAVGAGLYFLRKWYKTKDELVCDVTDAEHQQKITTKIQNIAKKPMTWVTAFGIIAIAFSVNIIEFACSIGIAQTFTKILEINNLNFLSQQFYIVIYTIGYMVDDFIVFGLALLGYKTFYKVGAKYSKYSMLIAGALMVLLGIILIFFKDWLVL